MMAPAKLKRWLIVVAVVYLLFPRDLIPDFLGRGLGLIDDLVVIGLLTHVYRRHLRSAAGAASQQSGGHEQRSRSDPGSTGRAEGAGRARASSSGGSFDPYEVLGIERSASSDEIRGAYRARMQEYHPDKVAHLGEELQKLAHRKAQEIQRAYEQIRS